jgi:hypothetical protein
MRQRFVRVLAALLLVGASIGATAAVAGARGDASLSQLYSNSWE